MKKEIIYSDLDGTLLAHHGNKSFLTDENIEAVNSWVNRNHLFGIATGRNITSIEPILENSTLNYNLPLVLSNGTVIYDFKKKEILYQETFNKDSILEAIEFTKKNKDIVMLGLFTPYVEYLFVEDLNQEMRKVEFKSTLVLEEDIKFEEITKVLFIVDPVNNDLVENMCKNFKTRKNFEIIPSGPKYVELVNVGSSKKTAIDKALEISGINNYNLYTIGDYNNDLHMIKDATIGFAPANAINAVKEVAKYQVSHHNEHAVKEMIAILDNYIK